MVKNRIGLKNWLKISNDSGSRDFPFQQKGEPVDLIGGITLFKTIFLQAQGISKLDYAVCAPIEVRTRQKVRIDK